VSGVSRNGGSFVKCVAIQERLGIPGLHVFTSSFTVPTAGHEDLSVLHSIAKHVFRTPIRV
jgi:hypothetical protein